MKPLDHVDCLFAPRSVALVGASNVFGKWGYNVLSRLLSSRGSSTIYPVNRSEPEILGLKAHKTVSEIPDLVDLAIVTVPSHDLPDVMRDCGRKGVKTAVVITGGLSESGEDGAGLERELVEIAESSGIRFVGPNCLGIMDTHSGFSTLGFIPPVRKGNVALISQSGNSGQSVLSYGHQMGLGFSKFISSGNEASLRFEDYLEYLGNDRRTDVILGYVEGLRDGRRFLEVARSITRRKPVVIMKSGRTDAGSRAARSHSAALAGAEGVFDSALRQSGVIRAGTVEELVETATALLGQFLPRGRRVAVLSMGGGMAVTVADALRRQNLELPPLSADTVSKLDSVLSSRWSRSNPVDPAGDFVSYHCLWPMIEDVNTDAVLMVGGVGMAAGFPGWAPPRMKDFVDSIKKPIEDAELASVDKTLELIDRHRKPVIFTLGVTGSGMNGRVYRKLARCNRNLYPTPEAGARVLARLVEYGEYLASSI